MVKKLSLVLVIAMVLVLVFLSTQGQTVDEHGIPEQTQRSASREADIQLWIECFEDAEQVYERLGEQDLSLSLYVNKPHVATLLFYHRSGMLPPMAR